MILVSCQATSKFQSTLLQEERRGIFTQKTDRNLISIHAPTRGATNQAWIRAFGNSYFNPRSYKRSDPAACPLCCIPDIFQSTLLQEERPFLGIFAPDCCQFQSTLLQEERRVGVYIGDYCAKFQSTLLQEERRLSVPSYT